VIQQYLIIVLGAVVLAFFAFKEVIDMAASIEYAEGAFPRLKRWTESKKWHRLVLILTLVFYVGTLYELLSQPTPPPIINPDPAVAAIAPIVVENADLRAKVASFTLPESPNSLRRKTMKLADEYLKFVRQRFENHPPYGNVNDKEPSEETKKMLAVDKQYDQETADLYNRLYRDRFLAIIHQYQQRSIPTGFLENLAQNGNIMWVIPGSQWEGSPSDNLNEFRDLAYHVPLAWQKGYDLE
jgi:hypothetical protein